MEQVICKLVHNNYEKITDDSLFWLSNNCILKFTVILNKYSDKYGRTNYHKEVGYYKEGNYCVNINRSYDYYLLLENIEKDINGQKESVMIGVNDIYAFKYKLQMVAEWFTAVEHKGLFAKKDGRIFMPQSVNPIRVVNLPFNKFIEFEPSILNLDNGDQMIGVRIYLNNQVNSIFISIDRFLAFKYFIDTFNMHLTAVTMLNYLQTPDRGTNLYDINNSPNKKYKFL